MAVGMENLIPGDVAEISGEIIASESQSVELIGGVIITRSTEDQAKWPKQVLQPSKQSLTVLKRTNSLENSYTASVADFL